MGLVWRGLATRIQISKPFFPAFRLAPILFNEATLRLAGHYPRREVPPVPGSSGCKPDSK
jgi:hypothetical protein